MFDPLCSVPAAPDLAWFDAGEAAYQARLGVPLAYPPLNDHAAQRAWLAGFAGAWAGTDDPRPVLEALKPALRERGTLLAQLLKQHDPACWLH
ncbi:MAG: hypothetical protein EA400_00410 [Chromatiaceae bacterium]|nr:MAG: hypothetical protein EA400_00410 [Chromatiaceae bacterium]